MCVLHLYVCNIFPIPLPLGPNYLWESTSTATMYHICINKVQLPTKYTLFLLRDPPPPKKNIVDPKLG